MKTTLYILLLGLGAAILQASEGIQVESQAPVAFDRTKLVPLDEAVPQSALAPKPDYSKLSKASTSQIKPIRYRVIYESSVGGEEGIAKTAVDVKSLINEDARAQDLLAQTGTIFYEYTTASGQTMHIPLNIETQANAGVQIFVPSKASYGIVTRD